MEKNIDKILCSKDFEDLKTTYSQKPGKLFPIFLDVASLGQNNQRDYSKYFGWTIIFLSGFLAYLKGDAILVSFGIYYLLSLTLLFSASQIEMAVINYRTEKLYDFTMKNLPDEVKKRISQVLLNKEIDEKFKDDIRGILLKKLEILHIQSEKNLVNKIEPTHKE